VHNLNDTLTFGRYKVEEKLHLAVSEKKKKAEFHFLEEQDPSHARSRWKDQSILQGTELIEGSIPL
jgi:hypothetical protein